jgi:hypothetical protein
MNRSRIMFSMGLVWAALLVLASSSGAAAAVLIAEFELSDQMDRHQASDVSHSDGLDSGSSLVRDSSYATSAASGSYNSKPSSSSAAGSGSSPSLSNSATNGGAIFDGIATDPISFIASPDETIDLGSGPLFSNLPLALTGGSSGYSSAANQSDSGDLDVDSLVDVSLTALSPVPEASTMTVWGALIVTALMGCMLRSRLGC